MHNEVQVEIVTDVRGDDGYRGAQGILKRASEIDTAHDPARILFT
jgi:hypothetical protein